VKESNMPAQFLLWSLYSPEFAAALCHATDVIFPKYWPSVAEAEDAMLACLGCPL
jgi:hypothetical protein